MFTSWTGAVLCSFGFSIIFLGYIVYILLKWLLIFLKSWTSIGYFSNSTASSVTSGWLSLFIQRFQMQVDYMWVGSTEKCTYSIWCQCHVSTSYPGSSTFTREVTYVIGNCTEFNYLRSVHWPEVKHPASFYRIKLKLWRFSDKCDKYYTSGSGDDKKIGIILTLAVDCGKFKMYVY